MAQVESIRVEVESTGFFDSFEEPVDTSATLDGFADALTARLQDAYPDAEIDVRVLADNRFSSEPIRVVYSDGDWAESGDAALAEVEDIMYRLWDDAGSWVVELAPES